MLKLTWVYCITIALFLTINPMAAVEPEPATVASSVDRCGDSSQNAPGSMEDDPLSGVILPEGDLFLPLLADMKQPQFYASYRRVKFRGTALPAGQGDNEINAGIVALGGNFGLWGLRQARGCDGFQVNLMTGIFSQFNLSAPSADLINTDFIVGMPLTFRRGGFSSRMRLYHQSSHLGDELLLNNPDIDRLDLSFEAVDLLLSFERNWWRLYGGGGYVIRFNPGLDPGLLQWGLEWRGSNRPLRATDRSRIDPVFGVDFNALEEREWAVTTSIKSGIELSSHSKPVESNRLRVLFVYLRGYIPFGQFFNSERLENYGFEFQIEY